MITHTITFKVNFKVNEDIFTPEELLINYLFGIEIEDRSGGKLPYETHIFYIRAAQEIMEKHLSIKFLPQIVTERKDFVREDFSQWGFLRTTYPVKSALALHGFVNSVQQIEYPPEWLSTEENNVGDVPYRQFNIVPVSVQTPQVNSVVYSGITPHLGFFGYKTIPNYWKPVYYTGFNKIPFDLKNYIGRLAAIGLFDIGGSLVLGAGIASMSIGVDGLSQSISTTQSAENHAYSATIKSYRGGMKEELRTLEGIYKGLTMGVV